MSYLMLNQQHKGTERLSRHFTDQAHHTHANDIKVFASKDNDRPDCSFLARSTATHAARQSKCLQVKTTTDLTVLSWLVQQPRMQLANQSVCK